jgi:hypothetical protein
MESGSATRFPVLAGLTDPPAATANGKEDAGAIFSQPGSDVKRR